jgi:membrane protease subunit HflK
VSTLLAPQPEIADLTEEPRLISKDRKYRIWAWLLGLWILSGIFLVSADQQAVVARFGAVISPRVLPGIHYALPWPIDSVNKLKVHQLRRTVIGGEIPDAVLGRIQPASSEFLSGDQNLLNVRVIAQYSVSEPKEFLFATEDVDRVVKVAVE